MTDAKQPNLRILVSVSVLAFAVLCALGVWQLQRLEWKQGLIARIEARIYGTPQSFQEIRDIWAQTGDVAYSRVSVTGRFLHDRERHYYSVINGRSGWEIFTPLAMDRTFILVNRGFVPARLKSPDTRSEGQVEGTVTLTGLVRETGSQGWFVPDNDPGQNVWYWRDLRGMSYSMGIVEPDIQPFYMDLQEPAPPGGLPRPGTTRLDIPNKHLSYALTWFALAGILVVVAGLFVRKSYKEAA